MQRSADTRPHALTIAAGAVLTVRAICEEAVMNTFETAVFSHGDHAAARLPADCGFVPGDEVLLIKIGDEVHMLHADAPETGKQPLLRRATTVATSQVFSL